MTRLIMDKTFKCCGCKKYMEIFQFYPDKTRTNGVTSRCKKCNTKRRNDLNKHDLRQKINHRNSVTKYISKYPYRQKARMIVRQALLSGKIKKKICDVCGKNKVHAHHPDYSKPLEVIWLCTEHHYQIHHV